MKRMSYITGTVLTASILLGLTGQIACKSAGEEQIKASLEILDMKTSWVMKEYRQWPNPKLTLVPSISFQAKNLTTEPLRFLNFNAVFKAKDAAENLGDDFRTAVGNEGIPPGGMSPVITMVSNFGVEGKTLESFKNNPQWQTYFIKLFVQMKGSRHILLGEWPISRQIDFKEDTAVLEDKKPADIKKDEPVKK